jgi:hypothetical protein
MAKTRNELDPLASIDLGMIDALQALRQEAAVLRERLASLDAMKQELAAPVFARVSTDYNGKLDAIERQATPLREQARSTWAGLRDALAGIDREHEAVLLDQQENDLRHKLGEFDDEEYAKRCKDIEATLAERVRAHDKAAKLRTRFLEVFDSEAELEAPLSRSPAGPAAPASTQEIPVADEAAIAATPGPAAAAPRSVAATQILSALNLPQPPPRAAPPAVAAPVAGPKATSSDSSGATAFFRTARLVPQTPEAGRKAIPLPPKSVTLGADTGADIRVGGPGVESLHARIDPTARGYTLTDLGSQHGTRVNAEPVGERVLHDEDVIQIGAARFVFRED